MNSGVFFFHVVSDYLTLTRVVFESDTSTNIIFIFKNLTLTRVVFEYVIKITIINNYINLTLTRVVFECYQIRIFRTIASI